jgi:hypothetical protein
MDTVSPVLGAALICVLAAPFLLALSAPWLFAAAIAWRLSAKLKRHLRVVLASSVAAPGVAPVLYPHGAVNLYVLLLRGESLPLATSLLSLLSTWAVLLAAGFAYTGIRRPLPRSGAAS